MHLFFTWVLMDSNDSGDRKHSQRQGRIDGSKMLVKCSQKHAPESFNFSELYDTSQGLGEKGEDTKSRF